MAKKFRFGEYLQEFESLFEEYRVKKEVEFNVLLEDENFRYRLFENKVQVGVKRTFDRWANSIDYMLHRLPKNELEWRNLFEYLRLIHNELVQKNSFNNGFGQESDITHCLRQK